MIIDGIAQLIVKYLIILGFTIFSIISSDFFAVNHLLCIIDDFKLGGEHGSVLDLLLFVREVLSLFPGERICFSFDMQQ